MSRQNRDVVVIGASAGGVRAIARVAEDLPPNLAASVLSVVHVSPRPTSNLHTVLCGKSKLSCMLAKHGDALERGNVYVAPPDRHMRVVGEEHEKRIQVDRGPRENRSRPSIDVLFRSAAASCGPRVIALLMTGYLDDGVAGLSAVKRAGGRVLVQDPADAEVPDLPLRALESVQVDARLPLAKIAGALAELVGEKAEPLEEVPPEIALEAALSARAGELWPDLERIGKRSSIGCPHCGGPLWALEQGAPSEHYRCHLGHGFSANALVEEQNSEIERALYSAIRVIEEKARFLRRIIPRSERYRAEAEQAETDAHVLRRLLTSERRPP